MRQISSKNVSFPLV